MEDLMMEFKLEDSRELELFENLEKCQLFRFADSNQKQLYFKADDGYVDLRTGYVFLTGDFPDIIGRRIIKLEQIEPIKVREV